MEAPLDTSIKTSHDVCHSLNFILIIKVAIQNNPNHWKAFLALGIKCMRTLSIEKRAFALSELAVSLINIDLKQSRKLALRAMDYLNSSRSDLFLIAAQNVVAVLSKISPPALDKIEDILYIINARADTSPINKISTLVDIARMIKRLSLQISRTAIILAANLIKFVPTFERFEAEGMVSAGIYDVFNDNFDGALELYSALPSEARVPYRRALVRILQKLQNKPFYELDLSPIALIYPELAEKIEEILSQKKSIRTKIKKKLDNLDVT